MSLTIDAKRVSAELETLAAFTQGPGPGVTRVIYTKEDMEARRWLKGLCEGAGLVVREDAVGNLFARWEGLRSDLGAIATGSHTDAIPNSGMYDGTVGVLGALEAIRALKACGHTPLRSIELVMFTSEEPTRFGLGCLGSRLMAGTLAVGRAAALKDKEGRTLEELRAEAGFTGSLDSVKLAEGHYGAFVELHIEQGPLLELGGIDIGVVEAIAAPAALRITLNGIGGHAGALLMPDRRDALCAASEIALAVEKAALDSGSPNAVATTGLLHVYPGAINSVPSRCTMEIDIRDTDLAIRDGMVEKVRDAAKEVTRRREVEQEVEMLNADPPAKCADDLLKAIESAVDEVGATRRRLVSRAYHDSLFMARIAPTSMIFIPCRKGVSHRPDEYSSPEQIALGVEVLARTLARLSLKSTPIGGEA
ncbi:hydantoinase/carbamoylase family amidase [bacterium]|nr:hydantoinase/carbamoylase family amidase [bacterium]